jgi:hypothetical protein
LTRSVSRSLPTIGSWSARSQSTNVASSKLMIRSAFSNADAALPAVRLRTPK